jgi:hypothetical protein
MAQPTNPELWKQAYRHQYGTDPDQDMAQRADDVEQWRINWQGGYDAGEAWARDMLNPPSPAAGMTPSAGQPMRTFADLMRQNPNIRAQYDTWRTQRAERGEDSTDWDAFRAYLTAIGAPDPGARPPDDFVGEDWKAQNPEWVARYRDRDQAA